MMEITTTNDVQTITGIKRFDRLLSGIYSNCLSEAYKRLPRTYSFDNVKHEASTSTDREESECKPIYSRQISRSTNFLSTAERNQKNILYNWSGLHAIARDAQVIRPNNVNQLVRLIQTAASKVTNFSSKNTALIRFFLDIRRRQWSFF